MPKRQFTIGEHKVVCDICARTRLRSQCRLQWDNLLVCEDTCYSPKHPNEYPRPVINDGLPVANARPRRDLDDLPEVTIPNGTTSWDDTTLIWESKTWIWSDNLSDVSQDSLIAQDPTLDL